MEIETTTHWFTTEHPPTQLLCRPDPCSQMPPARAQPTYLPKWHRPQQVGAHLDELVPDQPCIAGKVSTLDGLHSLLGREIQRCEGEEGVGLGEGDEPCGG